ncbi:MAG: hypothetical protein FD180_731 [Planctomycetota bacterium]|nr:MAG: hypothetical protein FD180_731 [Planctomycetota bacterium]
MKEKSPQRGGIATRISADLKKIAGKPDVALRVVKDWGALDAASLAAALRRAWPALANPADRQQLLKAMFHGRHPAALEVLDLGMGDRDAGVRSWASEFVAGIAFRDFRRDPQGYAAWRSAIAGRTVDDVLRENASAFVTRLRKTPLADRATASRGLFEAVRAGSLAALADAGIIPLLEDWVASGPPEAAENALRVLHRFPRAADEVEPRLSAWLGSHNEAVAKSALKHLREYPVSEAFQRANVLAIVRGRPSLRAAALRALGRKGASWAVEHLLPWVADSDEDVFLAAAESLAEIGDARAIPAMVEAMKADPSPSRIYNLGNFGLGPLTGLEYEPSRDGKWWEKKLLRPVRAQKKKSSGGRKSR